MRRLLDMMEAKQTEDDDDLACYRDWRDIAFVLDRLFFVLFLIMTEFIPNKSSTTALRVTL
jgi:hypothetical protein